MSELVYQALIFVGFVILALGSGIWIFVALVVSSLFGLYVLGDMSMHKIIAIFNGIFWNKATTWEFACIPLFIWMGEIILQTDVARRMFRGLAPWVQWLPGRLLHSNVIGCTLFAAISGSSTAATVTVGKITSHTLMERGYHPTLAVGSLAGAGTLGLLIPPSIIFIVYGNLTETSIARLFAAGALPGIMIAAMFSIYIMIACTLRRGLVPATDVMTYTWRDRLSTLRDLAPISILIVLVIGGIYSGIVTPTESAALGVFVAMGVAATSRRLTVRLIVSTLQASLGTSVMIITIIIAATFLTSAMGYLQIPQLVAKTVGSWNLGPTALILIIFLFYLILGCFLEGISILVMTMPIVLPLVLGAGFDPVWFGAIAVIAIEIAQITPPLGLNLFVLQSITGRKVGRIAVDSLPFFFILCLGALLLTIEPNIALWLPNKLYN